MTQKILIAVKAYIKLRQYVCKANSEISGLGIVEKERGILYVKDIWLLPQKSNGTTTEISKEGLAKMYDKLLSENKDTSLIKLWWHSHNDMPVFWSPTDINTIEDFDTEQPQENWFLSIVVNKDSKVKCRIDIFEPIRTTINDVAWEVDFSDENINQEVDNDMTANYEQIAEITEDGIIEHLNSINDSNYWFIKNGIPLPVIPVRKLI